MKRRSGAGQRHERPPARRALTVGAGARDRVGVAVLDRGAGEGGRDAGLRLGLPVPRLPGQGAAQLEVLLDGGFVRTGITTTGKRLQRKIGNLVDHNASFLKNFTNDEKEVVLKPPSIS